MAKTVTAVINNTSSSTNIFLDSGSQKSFAMSQYIRQHNLSLVKSTNLNIQAFNQSPTKLNTEFYEIPLVSKNNSKIKIQALWIDKMINSVITGEVNVDPKTNEITWKQINLGPDILVGQDHGCVEKFLDLGPHSFKLAQTNFGLIVTGKIHPTSMANKNNKLKMIVQAMNINCNLQQNHHLKPKNQR